MKNERFYLIERKKLLCAMDYIARNLNDERDIERWFTFGMPDGEIPYIDFNTFNVDDLYVEDEDCFKIIVGCFVSIIKNMPYDGIYCGGILSPTKQEYNNLLEL